MRAVFGKALPVKEGNMIAKLRARKPVGNVHRRFPLHKRGKVFVNLRFGKRIERGGWFVHDDHVRILIQRAGDGKLLRFAAGKLRAVLFDDLEKRLLQAFWERAHFAAKPYAFKRVHGARPVSLRMAGHVFKHCIGKRVDLLKHRGEH